MIRDVVPDEGRDAIVLDRTSRTTAPGRYSLWLEYAGWVHLDEVVDASESTVTRAVAGDIPVGVRPGACASWSGIYYRDPEDAGLAACDIEIETPAGPAPAWLIEPPGVERQYWAVHIHGLGSPRAGTLRGVQVAVDAGLTSLVVTYRNDGEGPDVGSRRSTLGETETDDVRAALRYAIARGAQRIALFGWSMGAAIALQLSAEAAFRDVVDLLILESPVLDWQATINANCARAGLPSWFGFFARPWLTTRALGRLVGLDGAVPLRKFSWLDRAAELRVPTLILHGRADTSAPYGISRRLAELRPDLVQLETFDADHTMTWNSEPERWQRLVRERITRRGD